MAGYNKCIIIGNLGRDATMRQLTERSVISFPLAVTKVTKRGGIKGTDTTWFTVDYWTTSSSVFPFLKKGTQVLAEGSVSIDKFIGKEGKEVCTLKLSATNILLAGNKGDSDSESEHKAAPEFEMASTPSAPVANGFIDDSDGSDDLPF